jgi:hypothetical protein
MSGLVRSQVERLKAERFRPAVSLILALCCIPFLWHGGTLGAQANAEQSLRGMVIFTDGKPVSNAKVRAFVKCDGLTLTQDATTAADGSFSFPVFHRMATNPAYSDADCDQYRFRASKEEDFWLASDDNIFTGATPKIPMIDLPLKPRLQPVQIVLSIRGGEVNFRVSDVATGSFVQAMLDLERKPVEGKKFGSVEWKTSGDSLGDVKLLPPGQYTVSVQSFPCGVNEYWTVSGPSRSFLVESATRLEETITIDVRNIKPLPTNDGHRRKNCKP